MSFGSAFGAFGSGAVDAYNTQRTANDKQDDRAQEQEIANAYGNTLGSLFGGGAQQPQQKAPSLFQQIGTGFSNFMGGGQDPGAPPPNPNVATPGMPQQALGSTPVQADQGAFQQQGAPVPPGMGPQGAPQPQGQGPMPPPVQAAPNAAPLPGEQPRIAQTQPQGNVPQLQALPQPNSLSWQQIVQHVQKVNPGASPAVIAGVADRFRPFMTDQSKTQWQQMQMEMKGQMLDLRQQGLDQQDRLRTRALDQTGQKIEDNKDYRGQRLGQIDQQEQGRNNRANQAEEGRNARSDTLETGRNTRFDATQQRLASTLNTRVQQATARLEQAKGISDRAAAIREYEQAYKEYRDGANQQLNVGRSMLFGKEKEEAQARIRDTMTQGMTKLDDIKRRISGGGNPQGSPGSPYGGLGSPPPASYPDRDADQGQIERSGAVQGGRAAAGKTTNRAPTASAAPPVSAAQPAQAPAQAPPPQVLQSLKEGVIATFGNGQKWTLRNGQPVQVP